MGTIFWREPDIKYRRNEAYLDIIENINVVMTANTTLRSDISGQIFMKSSLSGIPKCKIRFSDKVFINNSQLPATSYYQFMNLVIILIYFADQIHQRQRKLIM